MSSKTKTKDSGKATAKPTTKNRASTRKVAAKTNQPKPVQAPKVAPSPVENQPVRRGRGRPAGSTSFAKAKISQLRELLGDDGEVVVGRLWFTELVSKPTVEITPVSSAELREESAKAEAKEKAVSEAAAKVQMTLTP